MLYVENDLLLIDTRLLANKPFRLAYACYRLLFRPQFLQFVLATFDDGFPRASKLENSGV